MPFDNNITGLLVNNATEKTIPVDSDMVGLMDSAASNVLKKLSWANIKATLKTYFDGKYHGKNERINGQMRIRKNSINYKVNSLIKQDE